MNTSLCFANLSLPSELTLGRKYNSAYDSIGLFIRWKNWNLLQAYNLCLGVYYKPLLYLSISFPLYLKKKDILLQFSLFVIVP